MFGWEWKSEKMDKINLYKFTHTPLLKNDGQLKQKSDKQPKKKKKNSCLVKQKEKKRKTKQLSHPQPRGEKRGNIQERKEKNI